MGSVGFTSETAGMTWKTQMPKTRMRVMPITNSGKAARARLAMVTWHRTWCLVSGR